MYYFFITMCRLAIPAFFRFTGSWGRAFHFWGGGEGGREREGGYGRSGLHNNFFPIYIAPYQYAAVTFVVPSSLNNVTSIAHRLSFRIHRLDFSTRRPKAIHCVAGIFSQKFFRSKSPKKSRYFAYCFLGIKSYWREEIFHYLTRIQLTINTQ